MARLVDILDPEPPRGNRTMNNTHYRLALDRLRAVLATKDQDAVLRNIIKDRDACVGRYQPLFSLSEIARLTAEQFKSFLLFENNKHWSGLNRKGHRTCKDMAALRKS